ncbi:hypothetical protein IW140_004810 [Coemansia sp. RSA 1813]|nr:hypothetical protein EV178_004862 [Coemansia sp. RSA 1646]KAJ1768721.1 hypothetical protein LPJ74_004647 [Coemansia sp. RSA 1843]KAJ2088831.1 hypothetical protein IW138_003903 [Coemansia sp. RSA 986]KAJ2212340.1 hypothetical protein EV179_004735 [Coemansia sp. RSA 487]KAJ2566687.1 hypothetical protein IW140_004810 [Coemansia sp. RSA 1813]
MAAPINTRTAFSGSKPAGSVSQIRKSASIRVFLRNGVYASTFVPQSLGAHYAQPTSARTNDCAKRVCTGYNPANNPINTRSILSSPIRDFKSPDNKTPVHSIINGYLYIIAWIQAGWCPLCTADSVTYRQLRKAILHLL